MAFSSSFLRWLGCLFLTISTLAATAQVRKPDMLYKKDKSIIEAVIVEVSDTEIEYRRFSAPDGAVYKIKKADVSKIVYTNGETEELITTATNPDKKTAAPKKEVAQKTKPEKEPKATKEKVAKTPKEKVAKEPKVAEEKVAKEPKAPRTAAESGGIGFKVGVRAGANLGTISNNNVSAGDPTPGFNLGYHGGLVFNIGGQRFSVQPEVLYSQAGAKLEDSDLKVTTLVNTVTVPLLLKYTVGSGNLRFFVNAGGYASYALSAKTTLLDKTDNTTIVINTSSADFPADGRLQFGAAAGAGITYILGRTELFLDGRYYYGLGNNAEAIPNVKKDFFNTIQVGVGVLIPLGK